MPRGHFQHIAFAPLPTSANPSRCTPWAPPRASTPHPVSQTTTDMTSAAANITNITNITRVNRFHRAASRISAWWRHRRAVTREYQETSRRFSQEGRVEGMEGAWWVDYYLNQGWQLDERAGWGSVLLVAEDTDGEDVDDEDEETSLKPVYEAEWCYCGSH